jgi:plasmid maintenance system antidote protein VapI
MTFRPNWVSPPGETILAILESRSISFHSFCQSIELDTGEAAGLISGERAIDKELAFRISAQLGSTPHFWLERQRQFQEIQGELAAQRPALDEWFRTFPIRVMQQMGWFPKSNNPNEAPSELLDFFGVASIEEWRERYVSRLGRTNFRTSAAFENSVAATTAWIRRGELLADSIDCGIWDRKGFEGCLLGLKPLSLLPDPKEFLPKLQRECAKYGVAVIVQRCPSGCAASGATILLESSRQLLLLSARFLSDDQFWFSFFHEAGHIVLHGKEPSVEEEGAVSPENEDEANAFARDVILWPLGYEAMQSMKISKYSIARFARKCDIAPGVIVGQLQKINRVSQAAYNPFKTRYKTTDFSPESEQA